MIREALFSGVIVLASAQLAQTAPSGGLILSGLDTLSTPAYEGFDFVTQQSCTTQFYTPPYNCSNHFTFGYTEVEGYLLIASTVVGGGRGLRMGKINLDSVDWAPRDSVFEADGHFIHVDSIPPDSLQQAVGNVYVLRTGRDPRPAWDMRFCAKIKILDLNVVDSARHQVDLVFLWAFQMDGSGDLATTGLDTFGMTPVTPRSLAPPTATARPRPQRFTAVVPAHGALTLPAAWRGNVSRVAVYDQRGRLLGRVAVGASGAVELGRVVSGAVGMVVVRGE